MTNVFVQPDIAHSICAHVMIHCTQSNTSAMRPSSIIRTAALLLAAFSFRLASAQTNASLPPVTNNFSVGISAGHYRYDPGVAMEFTTRAIFQHHLSLRIRGTKQWFEEYKARHSEWIAYHSLSAGLVYSGKIFDRTRLYTEMGAMALFPDPVFSEARMEEGFYGLAGLDIAVVSGRNHTLCLFISAGPSFMKAYAEKMEGRPRYGHGLHFVNGLRVYFGK